MWSIEFEKSLQKRFNKLDKPIKNRMLKLLSEVIKLEDPRKKGKQLTGQYVGLWRYRVGDYRIICDIKDNKLTILVLEIGHRSNIY